MRLRYLTVTLLALCLLFVSCAKDTPDIELTDIKTPIIENERETTEDIPLQREFQYEVTARSWEEAVELSQKEKAKEFISAICLNDKEALEIYLQGDTVDELSKIKADIEIISEKEFVEYYDILLKNKVGTVIAGDQVDEQYKGLPSFECYLAEIMMSVTESESEFFPIGIYNYTLKISHTGFLFVNYFGPTERYEIFEGSEIPESTNTALNKSYKFIQDFLRFNSSSVNSDSLNPASNFDNILHIAVHTLMSLNENFIFTTTLDEFKEYMSLQFGYTDESTLQKFAKTLSEKSYAELNDDGSYTVCCAHGYSSFMYDLTDIRKVDNLYVYSYTFYADSAHTVPVKEMQFTFVENKDSDIMTLRNIKTANLNSLSHVILSP